MMRMMLLRLMMILMMVSMIIMMMMTTMMTNSALLCVMPLSNTNTRGKVPLDNADIDSYTPIDRRGRFKKTFCLKMPDETTMRHHSYKRQPPEGITSLEGEKKIVPSPMRIFSRWHHLCRVAPYNQKYTICSALLWKTHRSQCPESKKHRETRFDVSSYG